MYAHPTRPPIKIYPENNHNLWAIEVGGDAWVELKDELKAHSFTFKSDHPKRWVGDDRKVFSVYKHLQNIDPEFQLSSEILNLITPKPQTVFKRRSIIEDCLVSKPLADQRSAIVKGITQNRLLYAMEMGLGKTFVMISVINHWIHLGLVDKILIVLPPESFLNFKLELLRFNSFSLSEDDIYMASATNRNIFVGNEKIQIVKYRSFLALADEAYKTKNKKSAKKYRKNPFEKDIESWRGENNAMMILDESQFIKNPRSRTSKLIHLIKHQFYFRYALSGTPATNRIEDLWSQMTFLDPAITQKDFWSFVKSIANTGKQFGKKYVERIVNFYYPDKIKEFENRTKKWVVRQFNKDSKSIVETVFVETQSKHKKLYQSFVAFGLKKAIVNKKTNRIVPSKVKALFPYIQQAVDDPSLLKGKVDKDINLILYNQIEKWKFSDHSQIEVVTSLLQRLVDEENRKVIVWSGHPGTLNRLAEHYISYEPYVIHGEIKEDRDQILEDFKTSKMRNVLFASYLVIGRSKNIIESTAAIYWDRSWDLDVWLQSKKRQDRLTQKNRVFIYKLLCLGTLDEAQDRNLEGKDQIDKSLFSSSSLDKDVWTKIFTGVEVTDHKNFDKTKMYTRRY